MGLVLSIRLAWAFALLACSSSADSPALTSPDFRSLTVDDGLSQSHVVAIVQDHDGFMWFGTASGLNRYDGYSFRVYLHDPDRPSSIGNHSVLGLYVANDGRLWVGTTTGLDFYEPETDTFGHIESDPSDPSTLPPGSVRAITSDNSGNLWVATNFSSVDGGESYLNRVDPETGKIERFLVNKSAASQIVDILPGRDDTLWLSVGDYFSGADSPDNGLFRFDLKSGALEQFRPPNGFDGTRPGQAVAVLWLAPDQDGRIWVSTWGGGLWRFQPSNGTFQNVESLKVGHAVGRYVLRSLLDSEGNLWSITADRNAWVHEGAEMRIVRVDDANHEATVIPATATDGCRLSQYSLVSGYISKGNVLWLGVSGGGLCVADLDSGRFQRYTGDPNRRLRLLSSFVRTVLKDRSGTVWVAHPRGITRLDRENGETRQLEDLPGVQSMLEDRKGRLWLGGSRGLERIDPLTGKVRERFPTPTVDAREAGRARISYLHEARSGLIWVASDTGLSSFDPDSRRFTHHSTKAENDEAYDPITVIEDGPEGTIWIGGKNKLVQFDPKDNRFIDYGFGEPDAVASDLVVTSLNWDETEPKTLWVGTDEGGLIRLDIATGRQVRYTTQNSELPDNHIYGVLSSDDNELWISTNRGLASFSVDRGEFRTFSHRNLQALEFNTNAYFKAKDGELFFGGVGGLNSFYPRQIKTDETPPDVVIESVSVVNRGGARDEGLLRQTYRHGQKPVAVTLRHPQRDIVIDYAGIHFDDPTGQIYAYKLTGFDSDWRIVGSQRAATYTNLEPGSYTFHVKAANADGVWNEKGATLGIEVRGPWWRSGAFHAFSLGVLVVIGYLGYRFRTDAAKRREEELHGMVEERTRELESALQTVAKQAQELRSLDRTKSDFIANVSHEFRTPLALTIAPLKELRDGVRGPLPKGAKDDLELAIENSYRLLRLVEQLLEIARMDSGAVRLRVDDTDIGTFARDLSQRFAALARSRAVAFRVRIPAQPISLAIDREKMQEAVGNLLSNAFRFTPAGGSITLAVRPDKEAGSATISVEDSGPGISQDEAPHIFDRFFVGKSRSGGGTGIGLFLAKGIVDLHGGKISYHETKGGGATFEIVLPERREIDAERGDKSPQNGETSQSDPQQVPNEIRAAELVESGSFTVLIVEDDADVRRYIRKILPREYATIEVSNGAEGLDRAKAEEPDLVIADLMMPEMDGLEMCRQIKGDPALASIPVVLLTARATAEERLAGLTAGADAYVTKPFEPRALRAQVANILKSRLQLRDRLRAEETSAAADASPLDSEDRRFLAAVRKAVEARLEDPTLTVEDLAKAVFMSRVHLYRRLVEVARVTPSELILRMRLDEACKRLDDKGNSVSEVAYAVGFKNVSHFTRRFRGKFGVTPKQFQKKFAAN